MKQIRNLIFLLAFTLLSSCMEKAAPISSARMTELLLEMHLAEAYAQQMPKDSLQVSLKNEDSLLVFNARILKQQGVSEEEFRNSMEWYKARPDILDSIYQNILTEIAILQSKENK
jgi:hypothetical protein